MLWDRLFRLKQQGVTLVLTTHYMDEAEQLCDRLVVMDGGRIVAQGSPAELIAAHSTREVPLYQSIELLRGLTTGQLGPGMLAAAAYLLVLGLVGTWIAARRLSRMLLP